jgi:hypothetical protein
MARYETHVEDGTIFVRHEAESLPVGPVADALDVVGGPAWTIRYSEETKRRHPELDTGDEGLTVDVVDMIHAMTHSERFVDTLAAQPAEPQHGEEISPRLGLFVGKLLENLETGVT